MKNEKSKTYGMEVDNPRHQKPQRKLDAKSETQVKCIIIFVVANVILTKKDSWWQAHCLYEMQKILLQHRHTTWLSKIIIYIYTKFESRSNRRFQLE